MAVRVVVMALVLLGLCSVFNYVLTEPYMDEIFHIRQTQVFCRGERVWDDKITTLPGLYFLVLGLAWPLGTFGPQTCSVGWLRGLNLVFGVGCLVMFHLLLKTLHPSDSRRLLMLRFFALALFPVHFFFNFMFYTDTAATCAVLGSYYLALKQRHAASALAAAIAVCIRQTNVMWAVFIFGISVVRDFQQGSLSRSSTTVAEVYFPTTLPQLPRALSALLVAVFSNLRPLFRRYWAFGAVFVAFAAFLIINGGIVVGDRSNHVAVLHFPQLFYCVAFITLTCPETWHPRRLVELRALLVRPLYLLLTLLTGIIMAVAIEKFTYAHPFLLADNRHVTFYLWKNIFRRHPIAKFVLIPLYLFGLISIRQSLARRQCSWLWLLLFAACVAAMLVPSPLMEVRYYLIPCLFVLLHQETNERAALISILGYVAVNLVVLYVFLFRPFVWGDGSTARFMW